MKGKTKHAWRVAAIVFALPFLFGGAAGQQRASKPAAPTYQKRSGIIVQIEVMQESGIDRPGRNYKDFDLPTTDPGSCKKACDADVNCSAYTYVRPGVQSHYARCWLKWDVPAAVSNTCCVSGVKLAVQIPGHEAGIDRPGNNYRDFDLRTADPELCKRACNDDPQCKAYTYVKPRVQGPNARCWLKSDVPAAVNDSCCISGVKPADAAQNHERQRPPVRIQSPKKPRERATKGGRKAKEVKQAEEFPATQPTKVPDLSWMTAQEAGDMLRRFGLQPGAVSGPQTPDAVIVAQAPQRETPVNPGSSVDFTLVRPEVVLAAAKNTPAANEHVQFTLNFHLPLPRKTAQRAMAALGRPPVFDFYWEKDSPPEKTPANRVTHVYPRPGEYSVYADVEVAGKPFKSNTLRIVAGFQTVVLKPYNRRVPAGTEGQFTAEVAPSADPRSDVEYCFKWNDASPDTCGSSTLASHTYERPGVLTPTVRAMIGKSAPQESAPVEIEVAPIPKITGDSPVVIGEDALVRAELRPQPTAEDKVRYCFRWQDELQPNCSGPSQSRRFKAKGSYYVSVDVEVNGVHAKAGPLEVRVDPYQLTLVPATTRMETHRGGNFVVALKPHPPAHSRIEYCFDWDDRTPESCQAAESATHGYSSRGTYRPYVKALMDGESVASSVPLEIVVRPSWLRILVWAGIAAGTFVAAYGAHRVIKIKIRVTPHTPPPESTIAGAASISKGPLVKIRCVTAEAEVTLTSPGPVVRRKGKEPHVA